MTISPYMRINYKKQQVIETFMSYLDRKPSERKGRSLRQQVRDSDIRNEFGQFATGEKIITDKIILK